MIFSRPQYNSVPSEILCASIICDFGSVIKNSEYFELFCWYSFGNAPLISTSTEPSKSLGPPIVVYVQRTSDNPAGAPDHLTSSVSDRNGGARSSVR